MNARNQILSTALSEIAGPLILLDKDLRIIASSSEAEELVGHELPIGEQAATLLCGEGTTRPIADALAQGRAAIGTVIRPDGDKGMALRIHAKPLHEDGWILRLSLDAPELARGEVNFQGIITADPGMKRVLDVLRRAAITDVTVLLRGETGTGKELFAKALHNLSSRADGPFRAINCAALSPTLLESELFGHVRGAFTGAVRDSPGHFRSASGGTLFLDEVAEMPADLQAKLLRVIETNTLTPVGGIEALKVDVRIVAATHKSLRQEVAAERFRADLMYRLRKVPLFLPPLRKRAGDIQLIARHMLKQLNKHNVRQIESISSDALAVLNRYQWPGNVRELANALEYAYVVGDGTNLNVADLPPEIVDPSQSPDALMAAPVNAPPQAEPQDERERILRALERNNGSKTRTARSLGISRVTLWRHMKELGI
jgi:transcriptional regulator with PAS, ATPase and Fis domain